MEQVALFWCRHPDLLAFATVLLTAVLTIWVSRICWLYSDKARLKRLFNACLPNFIDFRISTHLGPLYFSLIEIETDCEDMNYRPRLEPYQPRICLITFQWEKAEHSHFRSERSLIGYQLNSYEGET